MIRRQDKIDRYSPTRREALTDACKKLALLPDEVEASNSQMQKVRAYKSSQQLGVSADEKIVFIFVVHEIHEHSDLPMQTASLRLGPPRYRITTKSTFVDTDPYMMHAPDGRERSK